MPDSVQTLVETTIGASATLPATFDGSGYGALTFTAVGQVTDWTPAGQVYAVVTSNPIAQRSTDKYKGTFNNGADSITVNRDDDDAGQVEILTALSADADYAFSVTYRDATVDYFTGKVVSFDTVAGGADSIVQRTISLERTRSTVTV
tara:strand:+ start:2275 stop:2718 length:444 start_codon:yes stop_codon:yes gene_type:complete